MSKRILMPFLMAAAFLSSCGKADVGVQPTSAVPVPDATKVALEIEATSMSNFITQQAATQQSAPSPAPTDVPVMEAFGEIAYTTCNEDAPVVGFASCEIYRIDADGSNPIRLTNNDEWDHSPSWSPDKSRITFVSNRDGNFEIYSMLADGGSQINLTNHPAIDTEPAWSPDGTKIAFVSNRGGLGSSEIYIMDANGENQTQITNTQDNYSPAWSPDGTKIVYRRDNPESGGLYIMNADGSSPIRVYDNPFYGNSPAWSPDGTKIVFSTSLDSGLHVDIYLMNTDGSGLTQLSTTSTNDDSPTWSPDGSKIVFSSLGVDDNSFEINMINTDGTGLGRLVENASLPDW